MRERVELRETPIYKNVGKTALVSANIGERYWLADLCAGPCAGSPYALALRGYARELPDNSEVGMGVLLWGPHGSGKTSAACRLLVEAMARGPALCYFIDAADIDWYANHRTEITVEGARVWDLITRDAQFLVIDDLGAENDATWRAPSVERVLTSRYHWKLPTFITSNLNPRDLYERCPRIGHLAPETLIEVEVSGVTWRG